MRKIFSVSLVAVRLLFFTRTYSKGELQSNDSTSTYKVCMYMIKVIPSETEVSFKEVAIFQRDLFSR